jgi:lipopolysaccharide export system permease protein
MSSPVSQALFPVGTLNRYLIAGFMRVFALTVMGSTLLYFVVDFFEHIDNFLEAHVAPATVISYFIYKIPLSVSRIVGIAALFSTFFSIGLLSRNKEITALRACGVSLARIAIPLVVLSIFLSLFSFFWNESLVPLFTSKAQQIYKTEIRKSQPRSLLGSQDIWLRSREGFISADYFDARKNTLESLTIYLVDQNFSLTGVVEAKGAHWNGSAWEAREATEWMTPSQGQISRRPAGKILPLSQTPEDFKVFARDPEEFTFFDLQRQIEDLKQIGVDTTEHQVDLQVKLAIPWVPTLMVILAIPFALKHGPRGGMALSFGLSALIGFSYWVLLAFGISLGRSGVIPPWVSAWVANLVMALVGLYFFTGEE